MRGAILMVFRGCLSAGCMICTMVFCKGVLSVCFLMFDWEGEGALFSFSICSCFHQVIFIPPEYNHWMGVGKFFGVFCL